MSERKKAESISGRSLPDTPIGTRRTSNQSQRLTYEAVRATIGTRQASFLERKGLPPITKQVERKLIVR